jgi:hypothetical protein
MKLLNLVVAVAAMSPFAQSAQARVHHHHQQIAHHDAKGRGYAGQGEYRYRYPVESARHYPAPSNYHYPAPSEYRGQYGVRPAAWCGWEMRQLVSSDPGPTFNLARNWAHWGHAAPAGIGAVVVWSHHVGKIVGQESGMWVIESGNDDHMIRTRPRSIAGAIAIRKG